MADDATSLQRRNHELSILTTIAAALNREVDLSQALRVALAQVAELFDLRTGWVWLLNEQTGAPYLAAAEHLPPALEEYPDRMEGSCYCLDTFQEGDLEQAANISIFTCSRLRRLIEKTDGLRYHASIPLIAHGRKIGMLNVASPDWRKLSSEDLRLLHAIGDLVGMAVERARLYDRSTQLGAAEERNRLAREIHDTLAQGMTAIALQLEVADALLETESNAGARSAVQRALALTQANLEEARRSVLDLRAAPLEGRTLAEALATLDQAVAMPVDLSFRFGVVGAERPLPPRIAVGLYRIAQEGLNNIIRHAQATSASIQLTVLPEQARLSIADDGQGFAATTIPAGHFGLIGIRERARLLDGTATIASTPGLGTRIDIYVPLDERQP